jgi:hypothetical protein
MSALKILLVIPFIFCCFFGTTTQQIPADTIIRLEQTDCFYTCPAYVVTISADGLVTFEGKANVKVVGKSQSRIPVEKVQMLVATFLKIRFFSFRDRYNSAEDGCNIYSGDTSSTITSIVIGGRSKSVDHYHGCFPKKKHLLDGLMSLEEQIDDAVNIDQWIK